MTVTPIYEAKGVALRVVILCSEPERHHLDVVPMTPSLAWTHAMSRGLMHAHLHVVMHGCASA